MNDRENRTSTMDLTELEPDGGGMESTQNMDFLLDIPLEITVELGSSKITIGELLKLSQGSVVELNRLTDEPLDIFVNKKLMAHGEVVVVNEKFGIRLTNIVSPGERVKVLS
jgi:flagellar motor switch protein FliN